MQISDKGSSVYPLQLIKVPVSFAEGVGVGSSLWKMSPWSPNWTSSAVVFFSKWTGRPVHLRCDSTYGWGKKLGTCETNTKKLAQNSLLPTSVLNIDSRKTYFQKAFDIKDISSSWFRCQNQKRVEKLHKCQLGFGFGASAATKIR